MKTASLKIGQLAKATGVSNETIRFYESKGLLTASERSSNGYRHYGSDALQRLRFILRAKRVGFSLDEIAELLALRTHADAHTCEEVKHYTQNKMQQIDSKIAELQAIRQSLATLHQACCGGSESAEHCSILNALDDPNHE
ncbi:Zn(2+)-responsive transcriptional regulator [Bowmanella sp. JS7-9]|uniref:Zn(2+)-responsive transcriptional regulator n=1 Tax=Pseudobowmanella zhangzhouensis TaxID=1537679 RepID=A0ABW1XNJ2_9ALTE|nr:Zn(2+)-responsive transcriptional regulator [Bowmanella sp. JS7-9]TBX23833.1 zinc-responsive transcriptional regulator [Bowmanella sp. JS7-9]